MSVSSRPAEPSAFGTSNEPLQLKNATPRAAWLLMVTRAVEFRAQPSASHCAADFAVRRGLPAPRRAWIWFVTRPRPNQKINLTVYTPTRTQFCVGSSGQRFQH
jgi:hypothetical protein